MNAKRRDDDEDLDTDTGLPRKGLLKLGTKLFLVLLMTLQVLVTGIVTYGLKKQEKMSEELVQLRIEMARIQVFLKIPPTAWVPAPPPASSVAIGPVQPSNTP